MTSSHDPLAPPPALPDPAAFVEVAVEQVADRRLPDGSGRRAGAARTAAAPMPAMRSVSGRYGGRSGPWRLELRVDVDGHRPLRCVSGDFFRCRGSGESHFGSFRAADLAIAVAPARVRIEGTGEFTFATAFRRFVLTIPRRPLDQPPPPADIRWLGAAGARGARYLCEWESRFFRSVELEEDVEAGVDPVLAYDTGALPSGGPGRRLDIVAAFAEAGVEIRPAGERGTIATAPGGSWSNAELHAAMQAHFSHWADIPQWKLWLLHAHQHERGPSLLGVMFDDRGRHRQGCAVFYAGCAGTAAAARREQLFTCIHELGHCFNLHHSFHKERMTPPEPNRPEALSWMNYPWLFPGGAVAFWAGFPFQFDAGELLHLRHAAREAVIMGGQPFGGAGAPGRLAAFAAAGESHPDLTLELRADRSFRLGEPVVVELKLAARRPRAMVVHRHLHPADGLVTIAIEKPGGVTVLHEPLVEHCLRTETVELNAARPAIYDSAYVGCGAAGLAFTAPGLYRLRALYRTAEGAAVVSNTLELRVRGAHDEADEAVADLLLDAGVGTLFALLGSEAPELAAANARLDRLLAEYGNHPLALYARLVQGYVRACPFRLVAPDATVRLREARPAEAVALLEAVVAGSSAAGRGIDSISLNQVFRRMIAALKGGGDETGAERLGRRMLETFRRRGLKPHVLAEIARQRDAALAGFWSA